MKPVPLTQQLVDSIREDILSGHYEPHSNLRQDALAEKYGVSRIPVREALLQLEGEGLVSIQPRRGAIVTPLSLLEVDDVFALRLLLEIRLYHASAPKLDAAAIEMASEANQRYRDAIVNQQHAVLGAINAELHMALYREAPLPTTRQIVAALLQTSQRYTRIQLRTDAALQQSLAEHDQLLQLTHDGNYHAAETLLDEHIRHVWHSLREMINAQSHLHTD